VKVLIVGGGGREHALAWKFKQEDPHVELIAAPGNPGIAELARCVRVAATDVEALAGLARAERPDVTVVGPETPLALGIVDRFRQQHSPIFGPTRAAAEIESSKVFAKQLMVDAGVPTAHAVRHTDPAAAKRTVREFGAPVVIKASGLAAGKGVIVATTLTEADAAIDAMLTGKAFGAAGMEILVEEFLEGEEVSLLFLTDGEQWLPFLPAQDHKRLLDGDRGPNTGGMGAYAPIYPLMVSSDAHPAGVAANGSGQRLPGQVGGRRRAGAGTTHWADWDSLIGTAGRTVVDPTLAAMRALGRPFTGVLYVGLMLTDAGIRVVEFNCRMGDPETEAILPLTGFRLLPLMQGIASGDGLGEPSIAHLRHSHAVTTVVAAAGYPDTPRTGDVIRLPAPEPDVHVFHAGTARNSAGALVTAAGRVLAVTAVGVDLAAAQQASAGYAARVEFEGKQFRTDIAWRALARSARAT
jgi:phosphoribosylamine---glycine ligase